MSKKASKITDDTLVSRLQQSTQYISDFVTEPSYNIVITPEGYTVLNKHTETLSNLQIHILVVCLTEHTFYETTQIIQSTVEKFSHYTPTMFADAVVRLIQRGLLSKTIIESKRPSISIEGTLTININGTISFVPSDARYSAQSGSKTWLLISNLPTNIPTTRPIHIDGSNAKTNY